MFKVFVNLESKNVVISEENISLVYSLKRKSFYRNTVFSSIFKTEIVFETLSLRNEFCDNYITMV